MKSKSKKLLTGLLVVTAVAGMGAAGVYANTDQVQADEKLKGGLESPHFRLEEDHDLISIEGAITAIDESILTLTDQATNEEYTFPSGPPNEDVAYSVGQVVTVEGFEIDSTDHPRLEEKGINFIAKTIDGEEVKKPHKMERRGGSMQNLTEEERAELQTMREEMLNSLSDEQQERFHELMQKMHPGNGNGNGANNPTPNE